MSPKKVHCERPRSGRPHCCSKRRCALQRRRPAVGGPSTKSDGVGLDGLDVHCLRSLVAGLGVIGDLRTLSERPVAVADDPGVVDEEVLSAVIRCDEAEALLVAEPLDCAVWHSVIPPRVLCAALRGGSSSNACTALAESIPGPAKRKVAVNRALRESARRPEAVDDDLEVAAPVASRWIRTAHRGTHAAHQHPQLCRLEVLAQLALALSAPD